MSPFLLLAFCGLTTLSVAAPAQPGPWAAAPDSARGRVMIVMDGVKEGVRVQTNGQAAGGCIVAPFMLDVTRLVKAGSNTVRIEPFAPGTVKLAAYPR